MILVFVVISTVVSLPYAPPPSLPAAPNPYGTPLNGKQILSLPPVFVEHVTQQPPSSANYSAQAITPSASTSIATASPPPPQPPQTFDDFANNIAELDLDWNQLLESTTASSTTVNFVPSHSNIANVLTGGDEASFIDQLPQWSENVTTTTIETLQRFSEAKEDQ